MSVKVSLSIAIALLSLAGIARAAPPPALEPVEGRVVWVDFWASWCVPCRRSFPWLKSAGLQIIAVNLDKERALADGFLAEVPAEFALRFDPSGALAKEFGVQAMPSSYLIDADGNVLESHFGFKTADTAEYEQGIEAALQRLSGK